MTSNNWYDHYNIILEQDGRNYRFKLDDRYETRRPLSPLSNFLLNTIMRCIDTKNNLIFCFQSSILNVLPIVSFIYSDRTSQDTSVFTYHKEHYKNYYRFKINNPETWIWMYKVPAGLLEDKNFKMNPVLKNANRGYRRELLDSKSYIRDFILNEKKPKVIFCKPEALNFKHKIDELRLTVDGQEIRQSLEIPIKNLIFENFDGYVNSEFRIKAFLEWINLNHEDSTFFIHLTNPHYTYLNMLKDQLNAVVLYCPLCFMNSNRFLSKKTKTYHDKGYPEAFTRYSVDKPYMLKDKLEMIDLSDEIPVGNIDLYGKKIQEIRSSIETEGEEERMLINTLLKVYYTCRRLWVYPVNFKMKFYTEDFGFRYYYLKDILNEIRYYFTEHQPAIVYKIDYCIKLLKKMIDEMSECKRYWQDRNDVASYSRISKQFQLFKLLEEKHKNNEKAVIAVNQGEQNLMIEMLDLYFEDHDFQIQTFRALSRSIADVSKLELYLPGPLKREWISILFRQWKRITIFSFQGDQNRAIQSQLKLLKHADLGSQQKALEYIKECLTESYGYSESSVLSQAMFKDYYRVKKKSDKLLKTPEEKDSSPEKYTKTQQSQTEQMTIEDICRKLISDDKDEFEDFLAEDEIDQQIEKREQQIAEETQIESDHATLTTELFNYESQERKKIALSMNKTFLFFKDTEDIDIKTGFPYVLKPGDNLVLFDSEARSSIIDIIEDMFSIGQEIDYETIHQWHKKLSSFYNKEGYKSYKAFWRDFKASSNTTIGYQAFTSWIKGEVNAPRDEYDLKRLGILMDDDWFSQNYRYIQREGTKIRIQHMIFSRKIKKIVKQIFQGDLRRSELSYEENLIIDKIENNIYRIEKIGEK